MKIGIIFLLAAAIAIGACQPQQQVLVQKPNVAAECVTDSDCTVAGCSGQICTTAENAGNILTTCEYREEFKCLAKTNCGCVEGKCGWAETPEYETCIASFS